MESLDIDILRIILSSMTMIIVVWGSLINWFEPYLPAILSQTLRYGKFAYNGKPSKIIVLEVPKSWFKHFYVFASFYSLFCLHLAMDVYLYGAHPPKWFLKYLDVLSGHSRKASCDMFAVITALSFLTLQSFKRFYETWFISVFSNGKINFSQYLIGYIHYWAAVTIILSEASGFKSGSAILKFGLNAFQILGIFIFAFAWIQQYKCAKILANLRKNLSGQVVSTEHKVPNGGLFNYISSPHLTCEILIYLSLYMILYNNQSFKYVFFWVLSNQVETALLSHWWYKTTFKDYPKERKAIIPFVF